MTHRLVLGSTLLALAVAAAGQSFPAQATPGQGMPAQTTPDRPGQQPPMTPSQQVPNGQQNQANPPAQNQQVTPPSQSQIMQALMNDPELSQYALTATVDPKGVVTLNGSVPKKQDKQQAASLVKSLGGVSKVQNSIVVNPSTTPLQGAAGATPQAAANPQTTPNQNPNPTSTPVTSASENSSPATTTSATPTATPGASATATRIQTALAADPALSNLQATANGNEITLTGNVGSKQDKSRAGNIAKQNGGGAKIHNQIVVSH